MVSIGILQRDPYQLQKRVSADVATESRRHVDPLSPTCVSLQASITSGFPPAFYVGTEDGCMHWRSADDDECFG